MTLIRIYVRSDGAELDVSEEETVSLKSEPEPTRLARIMRNVLGKVERAYRFETATGTPAITVPLEHLDKIKRVRFDPTPESAPPSSEQPQGEAPPAGRPPGWYHTMSPEWATYHYEFPSAPDRGKVWRATDGSEWYFDADGRELWEITRYATVRETDPLPSEHAPAPLPELPAPTGFLDQRPYWHLDAPGRAASVWIAASADSDNPDTPTIGTDIPHGEWTHSQSRGLALALLAAIDWRE